MVCLFEPDRMLLLMSTKYSKLFPAPKGFTSNYWSSPSPHLDQCSIESSVLLIQQTTFPVHFDWPRLSGIWMFGSTSIRNLDVRLHVPVPVPNENVAAPRPAPCIATLVPSPQLPCSSPGRPAMRPIYPPSCWPSAHCWPCSPLPLASPLCLAPGAPLPPVVFFPLTPHYRCFLRCLVFVLLHFLFAYAHPDFQRISVPLRFNP